MRRSDGPSRTHATFFFFFLADSNQFGSELSSEHDDALSNIQVNKIPFNTHEQLADKRLRVALSPRGHLELGLVRGTGTEPYAQWYNRGNALTVTVHKMTSATAHFIARISIGQ